MSCLCNKNSSVNSWIFDNCCNKYYSDTFTFKGIYYKLNNYTIYSIDWLGLVHKYIIENKLNIVHDSVPYNFEKKETTIEKEEAEKLLEKYILNIAFE